MRGMDRLALTCHVTRTTYGEQRSDIAKRVEHHMKKVLLVDDNTSAREALRLVLESQHIQCIEVGNGSEALQWLGTNQTDLIISDNQMPVLSVLQDSNVGVRSEAAFRLGKLGGPADIPALRQARETDPTPDVHFWATWSLAQIDEET